MVVTKFKNKIILRIQKYLILVTVLLSYKSIFYVQNNVMPSQVFVVYKSISKIHLVSYYPQVSSAPKCILSIPNINVSYSYISI